VVQKMSPFFILLQFLQMLTSFCNILPTGYWVTLQHNNYWFTHLTYVLLLHYLRETCQLHTNRFSNQNYTLLIAQNKYPVFAHNWSALEPEYHTRLSKCSVSSTHAWSLLWHSSVVPSTMLCNKHQSSAASGRPHLELTPDTHVSASRSVW